MTVKHSLAVIKSLQIMTTRLAICLFLKSVRNTHIKRVDENIKMRHFDALEKGKTYMKCQTKATSNSDLL